MKNQNTTKTNKPAVVIGSEVCYRTKAGSYNRAIVKNIVDSEFGPMAVLNSTGKDGNTIEFRKLVKNVWVYTGKAKAAAESEAEVPAAEGELAVGAKVFYATKKGKVGSATIAAIEGDMATIKYTFFNNNGGKPVTKKLQRNLSELYLTHEACEAALPAAEAEAESEVA